MRSYSYPPGATGSGSDLMPDADAEESPAARITASLFDLLEEQWNNACQFGDEITDDDDPDEETGEVLSTLEMLGENSLSFYTEDGLAVSITVTVEQIPDDDISDGTAVTREEAFGNGDD